MARALLTFAALAALLAPLAGCITEERIPGRPEHRVYSEYEEEGYQDKTEEALLEVVEEHPDSSRAWWALGDYYERKKRYVEALRAYEEMQLRIAQDEQKTGKRYTGGLYLIGKMHYLLRDFPASVRYMEAVLQLQPDDIAQAALRKDFKEAHLLLGQIYYIHGQFEIAERHLLTFKELDPASHRADTMLIGIEDALRRGGSMPIRSSYGREQGEPAQGGPTQGEPAAPKSDEAAPAEESAPGPR